MRLRLLPVAILALVLALGVKFGGMWTDVVGRGINPSLAQQAAAPPTPTEAGAAKQGAKKTAPRATETATPKATESSGTGGAAKNAAGEAAADFSGPAKPESALPDDPALFSQAEIDLLQKLSARRTQLDKWAQELEMREGLLKAAEQRIDRKLGELRQIQEKVQGMLRQYDKEQEDKLKSLVKIYEAMKPKEAAQIFMELDMPVLLDVVERMKEARSSPIIARLAPEKAKTVTVELAKRRKFGADAKAAFPARAAEASPPSPSPATPLPSTSAAPRPSSSAVPGAAAQGG